MSFVILIVFALFIQPINRWQVTQGRLGLKTTFWGMGVLGSGILYGIGFFYFVGKVNQADLTYQVNGALTTALACGVVYAYIVFYGIWNASKSAGLAIRWIARYFSFFFIALIIGAGIILKVQMLIAVVIILIMRKIKMKTAQVS